MRDDEVLSPLEVVASAAARSKGLLGRDGIEGAMLLRPAMSVHTLGMRFALDVAYCDADLVVVDVARMVPWRLGRPRLRSRSIIEAQAGAFDRWRLQAGDRLEIRP
ncbi:MAG: DUF192 domain-containing protein [Actinomycetota bacterium]|nr:DUF192 domain-containing protein [Actinomycetota bacterium]